MAPSPSMVMIRDMLSSHQVMEAKLQYLITSNSTQLQDMDHLRCHPVRMQLLLKVPSLQLLIQFRTASQQPTLRLGIGLIQAAQVKHILVITKQVMKGSRGLKTLL
ncbi:hypothetical protein FF1_032676 [Malus domestica]